MKPQLNEEQEEPPKATTESSASPAETRNPNVMQVQLDLPFQRFQFIRNRLSKRQRKP
jgi:hypothetical protein